MTSVQAQCPRLAQPASSHSNVDDWFLSYSLLFLNHTHDRQRCGRTTTQDTVQAPRRVSTTLNTLQSRPNLAYHFSSTRRVQWGATSIPDHARAWMGTWQHKAQYSRGEDIAEAFSQWEDGGQRLGLEDLRASHHYWKVRSANATPTLHGTQSMFVRIGHQLLPYTSQVSCGAQPPTNSGRAHHGRRRPRRPASVCVLLRYLLALCELTLVGL